MGALNLTQEFVLAELKRIAAAPDPTNLHHFTSMVAAAEARQIELLGEILGLLRK